MSIPTVSDEALLGVAKTRLAAAFGLEPVVYLADDVPGANGHDSNLLPTRWIEVGTARSVGGAFRSTGQSSSSLRYLTVGAAEGDTISVRRRQETARAALEGQRLTVAGRYTTVLKFDGQDDVEWLSGLARYWQLTTYRFAV